MCLVRMLRYRTLGYSLLMRKLCGRTSMFGDAADSDSGIFVGSEVGSCWLVTAAMVVWASCGEFNAAYTAFPI